MKNYFYILFLLTCFDIWAQQTPLEIKHELPEYYRKEEIIYDGKRYRIHNNYLTAGPGFFSSNIRNTSQRGLGIDFQFHIKRQHFQAGALMSGTSIGANNHLQGHIGYGYRKETKTINLAFFAGPCYYTGVTTSSDPVLGIVPSYYDGVGAYFCVQGVSKLTFDMGIGGELFAEVSKKQTLIGFKIIAFFSGAYVGKKRNYNPNVRSEHL